jgi:AraC-like DNA-binding protein/CheY-like chemotaxis protein
MNKVKIVWVDLRSERCAEDPRDPMPEGYEALHVVGADAIRPAIEEHLPGLLCFEYDYPAQKQMEALRDTRMTWPAIPLLMITVDHCEELAVWALRMRVWDYLVTPVSKEELYARLAMLAQASESRKEQQSSAYSSISPSATSMQREAEIFQERNNRFETAVSFVEENLAEKISLNEVAQLCGLGPFQFSRAFKQEQGTTFREFLLQRRINRALQLFDNPKASVTDVAFAAGFNDLSYFARVFRRFTGLTPSSYRQDREVRETMHLPMPEPLQKGPGEWPLAKYSYPSARKS